MSYLPDPCPLPDQEKKRRSLNERERFIYAPMSGVGGIIYDKDAVYLDLGGSHSHDQKTEVRFSIIHNEKCWPHSSGANVIGS